MQIPAGPYDDDQRHFLGWWPLSTFFWTACLPYDMTHLLHCLTNQKNIFQPNFKFFKHSQRIFYNLRVWVDSPSQEKRQHFLSYNIFPLCIIDLSTENGLAAAPKFRLKLQKFIIKSTDTFAMLLIPSLKWIIYMLITANLSSFKNLQFTNTVW